MNFFKVGDEPQKGFGVRTEPRAQRREAPRRPSRKEAPAGNNRGNTSGGKFENDSEWEEF